MKFESIGALRIFAMLVIVIGAAIPSPSGKFFSFTLAFLLVLPSVVLGSKSARLGGLVIGLVAVALAAACFASMRREQVRYVESAKAKSASPMAPSSESSGATQ